MPCIKQLSPEEAQKIAAGEVIERPANVVKELIENSLDAGATRITLFIEKAGKKLIRIIDDGCGMDEVDARACFNHHATSKISSVHDLYSINTFGFRGEALSSVASVSHVTLITRTADAEYAMKLELSEGRILLQEKTSAPIGTDLAIGDILFNVPVRKKFLKTDETEWRHILQLIHAVALSRRDIHLMLHHDGKQVLNCPPVNDYLARAAQLWDADLAHAMILCAADERGIRIEGMISDHTTYRYDRNALYFFVNGRWIKNYTLSRALMKGYANAIPASQFPTAALMITIDPSQIDINIHPRKEEVQFLHPRVVEDVIHMAVKATLEKKLSVMLSKKIERHVHYAPHASFMNMTEIPRAHSYMKHDFTLRYAHSPTLRATSDFAILRQAQDERKPVHGEHSRTTTDRQGDPSIRTYRPTQDERNESPPLVLNDERSEESKDAQDERQPVHGNPELKAKDRTTIKQDEWEMVPTPIMVSSEAYRTRDESPPLVLSSPEHTREDVSKDVVANPSPVYQRMGVSKDETPHTILGIYDKTYIMISVDDGILFIDQHAAHERILYEQFRTRFTDTAIITLMFPHVLTFTHEMMDLLEPYLIVLNDNGIHIKRHSEVQLIITATPVYLKNASFKDLIDEMLVNICEQGTANPETIKKFLQEKIHAQMACAAAVKAGDELSSEQIQKLLSDLANIPNKSTCPHGRPTSWLLRHNDLIKKFQRDYMSKPSLR